MLLVSTTRIIPGRAVPSFLSGRYPAVKVRKKLYVTKASEIASKKASAVILILGYAAAFAANSPNPSMEALLSFVSATVGIILVVQSYAIWTMIKFQGETINLNKFYKDK